MFPLGRRPPTTPGEVPLHRLQRQRGAGRKPAELAIPFVIVGGNGSPVTHQTSSPPPDWPSDMEEPPTPAAEPTLRTRDRISTPHPGGFSRPRSSSAPPPAGSGSRNMYYFDDGETTLVGSDQSDEVSSLTLLGETSFSEDDSDDSDNSNEEVYSDDDDDDDEENENDQDDNDEETGTYYMESPIQEQDARREKTFEVEISEEEYSEEEQEKEEEETDVEYVVDAEMREEEEVDQNQFDLSMMSAVEAHITKHHMQDVIQSPNESVIEYVEDSDSSLEAYREQGEERGGAGASKISNVRTSIPTIYGSQQFVDDIEESQSQAPLSQRVKEESTSPTPFPGTPPLQENQLIRTSPIPAEDGERFLDSQVYEASPTPRGNSHWFGRPLEWTPGKDFFEGQEQWASHWEGRALGSPLSCKGNRRTAIEEPETEHQSATAVHYEDDELALYALGLEENREYTTIERSEAELEPYTPEPEVERQNTAVQYDDSEFEPYRPLANNENDFEPYTPESEINEESRTIDYEDDQLEPYGNELRLYKWNKNIVYEGGELKPYLSEPQLDRQNTNIIHNQQSPGHPMSRADKILQQRDVRPSVGNTPPTATEDESNSETNDDRFLRYLPMYTPQMNELPMRSAETDETPLHQLAAAMDSGDGVSYSRGSGDHIDDDDNDRMYAFKAKTPPGHRTTLFEGRNVTHTGSPNVFNMPLPPPSEFDSSDEHLVSPIISDRTNAIMALHPRFNLNNADKCPFSPMLSGCSTTAHLQPLPDNSWGQPPHSQLPPLPHPYNMPDYNARNSISQNHRDNFDSPSPPPPVGLGNLLHKNRSKLPEMVDYQEGMDQQSSCDGDDEESEDGSSNSIASAEYPLTNIAPESAVKSTQGSNLNDLNCVLEAKQGQTELDNSAGEDEAMVYPNRRLFAPVDTHVDIPQNSVPPQTRPSWLKSIAHPAEVLQVKPPTPEFSDLGTSIPAFRNLKKKEKKKPLTRPTITKQYRVRKVRPREAGLVPRSRKGGAHKSIFGFDDPIVTRYFEDRKNEIGDAAREASARLKAPWLKRVEVPRPKPWYLMTCIDDIPETLPGHIPKTANYEPMSPTPAKPNKKRSASWDSRDDNSKKQRVDVGLTDESIKHHHDMLNKLMKKRESKSPGIFKSTERFADGSFIHPGHTSHRLDCFLAVATGKEFWFPAEEQNSAWEHCGQEAMFGAYGLVSEMGMGEEARELWAGKAVNKGN